MYKILEKFLEKDLCLVKGNIFLLLSYAEKYIFSKRKVKLDDILR